LSCSDAWFRESLRGAEATGLIHQQFDAEIHFEIGEALRFAFFEGSSHVASATFGIGVAIDADRVSELAAEELPHRHAPRLAREIPKRDFDAAHATRLARVAAKLLDAAEDLFDIAGVFAEDTAFEHGRIGAAGGVAHLAVADQTLVGVDLDQGTTLRRAVDIGEAHIGDLQSGWIDLCGHSQVLWLREHVTPCPYTAVS